MTAMMSRLNDISERDLSLIDLAFSMASAKDITLRTKPRDAAILSARGEMVKRLVVNDDGLDIDQEILRALVEVDADGLTKVMPPSPGTLKKLAGLGIRQAVLGGRLNSRHSIPPSLRVIDGLLEEEIEVLNRAWLKRLSHGTPYVTGLQILGVDGVPVEAGQSIEWGLEKYDIHSLLLKSGCIVNPDHLPDWSALLETSSQQAASAQILGQTVDFEFIKTWQSMEWLTDRLKKIRSNQVVWCTQRKSLAQMAAAGLMDELVTYVIPALEGRLSTRRYVMSGQGDMVGNGFRLEARFDSN